MAMAEERLNPIEPIEPMTEIEARRCVDEIKQSAESARVKLLELYEREGWRALGYGNFRECATAEFQKGQSQIYNLLSAAEIGRDLSTIVENLPDGHARVLRKLPQDERQTVYQLAIDTAPGSVVTALHLSVTVEKYQGNVAEPKPHRVAKENQGRNKSKKNPYFANPFSYIANMGGRKLVLFGLAMATRMSATLMAEAVESVEECEDVEHEIGELRDVMVEKAAKLKSAA